MQHIPLPRQMPLPASSRCDNPNRNFPEFNVLYLFSSPYSLVYLFPNFHENLPIINNFFTNIRDRQNSTCHHQCRMYTVHNYGAPW